MHAMRIAVVLSATLACACGGSRHDAAVALPKPSRAAESRALFVEVSRVLLHPRCVNCHTPDESPRQGEQSVVHDPPIWRGTGHGVVGMQCSTCHQDKNAELARIPGAPGWKLAPLSMVWLGQTPHAICEQIKDKDRNGGRTLAEVHDHLAFDRLVGWGWAPGADRQPAPGTQQEVAAKFQAWIDSGAECP